MDDVRDQKFAAWIEAERLAYEAIHRLHQSTQGGRLTPPPEAIAAVVALRRTANNHLAMVSNRNPPAVRRSQAAAPRPVEAAPFTRARAILSAPQSFAL